MRLINHLRVSLKIARMLGPFMGVLPAAGFVFGNIQPDIAVTTFVRNTEPGDRMRGHSYSTARKRMLSLLESLAEEDVPDTVMAYRIGKIAHYAADSFTFPHNPDLFHGSLKEHMVYERVLEPEIDSIEFDPSQLGLISTSCFYEKIADMHKEYEQTEPSAACDASFIASALHASASLLAFFAGMAPALAGNLR